GSVCREEDQRVRELDPLRGGRRGVCAGQLDQRGGSRGVVVEPAAGCTAVVAMRHDDDRCARRQPGLLRDEVDERRAVAVDRRREPVGPDVEAIWSKFLPEPRLRPLGAGRAGPSVGIAGGKIGGQRGRRRPVERGWQGRRLERRWLGDTESKQPQGEYIYAPPPPR